MGIYLTTTLLLVLLLRLFISSSSGASVNSNENGECISKGGTFPPYESEGKPPKSGYLEFKDLNLSKVFHEKTCCSASRMRATSLAVKNLATYGEAAKDCLDLFELLECSICDPKVGIQSGTLGIRASFCDRVFEACSDAYFSSDASNEVIVPCGASDGIICGKASKWESNGTAFCDAVGFTVHTADDCVQEPMIPPLVETDKFDLFRDLQPLIADDSAGEPCNGSKASSEHVMGTESSEKAQNWVWSQDLELLRMISRILINAAADFFLLWWRNQLQRLRMRMGRL